MLWLRPSPVVIAILFAAGCSSSPVRRESALPDLPRLAMASFRAPIREQLQKASSEAQAKPQDAEANGRLGMLLHACEQYESAERCYRRAGIFAPGRFEWAYYLGLVEALQGKNEEAAAALREAVRQEPDYLPARVKLAEVLLNLNRASESREVSQAALQQDPQFIPAYYWLGRAAAAGGDVNLSIENYRKACELWPSYGSAHYALALAYQKRGEQAPAREHIAQYEKFKLDGDPQPEDRLLDQVRSLDNGALAHLMKGVDLEKAGHLEQAIAEHEQALAADPKLAQAHANLIGLYARAGHAAQAEQQYRATVAINPNLPQSHYDFGVLLIGQAKYAEAEAAFRKALASSPHYADAHNNLAVLLERKGKADEAIGHYQAAIDNKPNNREAHFQLGRLLLMRNDDAAAIRHFEQTLTPEDAETPRFVYALGAAHAKAGNFAKAARYMQEAGRRAAALGQSRLAAEIDTSLHRVEQTSGR